MFMCIVIVYHIGIYLCIKTLEAHKNILKLKCKREKNMETTMKMYITID